MYTNVDINLDLSPLNVFFLRKDLPSTRCAKEEPPETTKLQRYIYNAKPNRNTGRKAKAKPLKDISPLNVTYFTLLNKFTHCLQKKK